MKRDENVRIRYSTEELEILKERAKKKGIPINDYLKEVSKKAKVKIEVSDEI